MDRWTTIIEPCRIRADCVIEGVCSVVSRAGDLRGYRIVPQPARLRHFTATFAPLD